MEDRYKLRAYLKRAKLMKNCIGITVDKVTLEDEIGQFCEPHNQVELMQCTGLKDKNGKLEYQGDLLRDYSGNIYELKYEVNSCGFLLYNHKEHEYYYPCCNTNQFKNRNICEMEVIGNIYETPELAGGE